MLEYPPVEHVTVGKPTSFLHISPPTHSRTRSDSGFEFPSSPAWKIASNDVTVFERKICACFVFRTLSSIRSCWRWLRPTLCCWTLNVECWYWWCFWRVFHGGHADRKVWEPQRGSTSQRSYVFLIKGFWTQCFPLEGHQPWYISNTRSCIHPCSHQQNLWPWNSGIPLIRLKCLHTKNDNRLSPNMDAHLISSSCMTKYLRLFAIYYMDNVTKYYCTLRPRGTSVTTAGMPIMGLLVYLTIIQPCTGRMNHNHWPCSRKMMEPPIHHASLWAHSLSMWSYFVFVFCSNSLGYICRNSNLLQPRAFRVDNISGQAAHLDDQPSNPFWLESNIHRYHRYQRSNSPTVWPGPGRLSTACVLEV